MPAPAHVLKIPRLSSSLAQVATAQQASGKGAQEGRSRGLDVVGGRVRVVLEAERSVTAAVRAAVVAAGGEVEASYAGNVQALVPPAAVR
jgi:hypothetical protein